MRKQLLIGALVFPALVFAQATKMTSETKGESTTTTPSTKDQVKTDKTVEKKTNGSSSTTVEKTATHQAADQPTKKTHTKKSVDKSPNGTVTKSETVNEKK
jgi:hypothetical protein